MRSGRPAAWPWPSSSARQDSKPEAYGRFHMVRKNLSIPPAFWCFWRSKTGGSFSSDDLFVSLARPAPHLLPAVFSSSVQFFLPSRQTSAHQKCKFHQCIARSLLKSECIHQFNTRSKPIQNEKGCRSTLQHRCPAPGLLLFSVPSGFQALPFLPDGGLLH